MLLSIAAQGAYPYGPTQPSGVGAEAVAQFASWEGHSLQMAQYFIPTDTADMQYVIGWAPQNWAYYGSQFTLTYSVGLCVDGNTLAQTAAGAGDAYYTQLANALATYGPNSVIRLGWEMNADWESWSSLGHDQDYINAFRHVQAIFKDASSNFKFDWCPIVGSDTGTNHDDPANCYPGDDVVDYIGMDVYDKPQNGGTADAATRWSQDLTGTDGNDGLNWQASFASQHGKQMSYPEWGVGDSGDNPYFVQQMYNWMQSNNVGYEEYWDNDMGPGGDNCRLDSGELPSSAAMFQQTFGGVTPAAPAAPSNLAATASSSSRINLTWTDNANNETGFKIERKAGAGGTYAQIDTVGVNVTSYSDTGLSASTQYYYRVLATNVTGDSSYSNEANATTMAAGTNTPVAEWKFDESTGTMASDATGNGNTGTLVGGASFVSGGKSGNAVQLDGTSGYVDMGNPADLQITGQITLSAWIKPTSTSGLQSVIEHGYSYGPDGEVSLRIDGGNYEVGYWNDYWADATYAIPSGDLNTWVLITGTYDGTAWNLYRNGALVASTTSSQGAVYVAGNWQVGATDVSTDRRFFQGGVDDARIYDAALSAGDVAALYSGTAPAAPSSLSATATSSSQVDLAWTDNASNETGFKIERKTGSGGTYAQIGTVGANVTSYSDTGLSASTQYYYRVRATNGSGDSGYSNEANATTQAAGSIPAAPSSLVATASSSSQIDLAWTDNASNETGFKIERKTGSGGTYAQIATVGTDVTSYSDTGLSASTQYYYRVRATNGFGDSGYSNEANATTTAATSVTITTADGSGADATLDGNGWDNSINNWDYDHNFGATPTLDALPSGTSADYVRMDLGNAGITPSTIQQATSATLTATLSAYSFPTYWSNDTGWTTDPGVTFSIYGLDDGVTWAENTITWSNAPALPPSANAQLLGTVTIPNTTAAGTTVTLLDSATSSAFLDFLKAETTGTVTFIITGGPATWNDAVSFATKENTNGYAAPTLQVAAASSGNATQQVNLADNFNRGGTVADGAAFSGGLDGGGYAYSTNLLGSALSYGGQDFTLGTSGNDVISAAGQTIGVTQGNYSQLMLLGTGVNGNQSGTITINYTDGTHTVINQGFSDWFNGASASGEAVAQTMSYRDMSDGSAQSGTLYLYAYTLSIDSSRTVASVTLPNNGNIELLAMDLVS